MDNEDYFTRSLKAVDNSGTCVKNVMQHYVYIHHNPMKYAIFLCALVVSGNQPLMCFGYR